MATTSDIAFWQILKDKVPRWHLDGPSTSLVFSPNGPKHHGRVLVCCLCLIFLSICFSVFSRARKLPESCHSSTRAALQALVTVVVPTCSLWPSRYVQLASVLRSHVNIPLEMIFKDTVNGVMEVRNPSNDLAKLIGSETAVNGQTLRISVGWKWWIRYLKWWILAESKSALVYGFFDCNIVSAKSGCLDLSPSSPASAPSTFNSSHCLDHLPRGVLPILNAGHKVSLEFTTFSPSLRTLSAAQIVSALPFMISERPRRQPRSLVSVLGQLTASYGSNVVIDSLLNVSVDYEHALHHIYNSSCGEQNNRERLVKSLGVEAWRRERFLVALEAALVRLGWVESALHYHTCRCPNDMPINSFKELCNRPSFLNNFDRGLKHFTAPLSPMNPSKSVWPPWGSRAARFTWEDTTYV